MIILNSCSLCNKSFGGADDKLKGGGGRVSTFSHFHMRHRRLTARIVLFQTHHKKSLVINFRLLKLVSTPICTHSPLIPPLLPAASQPPPLMLWRSTSLLLTQWLSSTLPAGGHTYPCPPSSNPISLLLAVLFTPVCAAVILHLCWQSTSPFPIQRSSSTTSCWRFYSPRPAQRSSFNPPAGGHIPPCLQSGHPLPLLKYSRVFSPQQIGFNLNLVFKSCLAPS